MVWVLSVATPMQIWFRDTTPTSEMVLLSLFQVPCASRDSLRIRKNNRKRIEEEEEEARDDDRKREEEKKKVMKFENSSSEIGKYHFICEVKCERRICL